jgi:sodium-dependent dicarboxylate transporter 2/3/5
MTEEKQVQKVGSETSPVSVFATAVSGGVMLLSPMLPVPSGMPDKGLTTLLIILFGIVMWLTKIINPAITSILIIVLLSLFQILSFDESVAGLGSEVVLLIIMMLCMGVAVEKTGLGNRVTFIVLRKSKGNARRASLLIIALACLLTFFIPNGMARLTLLLPIGIGLINTLKQDGDDLNFNKSVILAITFVPWICTVMIITGANGTIYAASLFRTMTGFEWSYIHWMVVMFPIVIVTLFGLWVILTVIFPPLRQNIERGQDYFEQSLIDLGVMKRPEKKLVFLYIVLIVLWVTTNIHGMSVAMSACLVATFVFVPGFQLIKWKEAMASVDWGIPLLFAAGFSIADALEKSEVIGWLSLIATHAFIDLPPLLLSLTIMGLFIVIRIGFTHFAAMIASLLPVALSFAIATPYNPIWLGMICVIASSMAYLLPSQSISNMATYSLGYYSGRDMFKAGSLLTIWFIIVTILFAFFYWPLVGVPIY